MEIWSASSAAPSGSPSQVVNSAHAVAALFTNAPSRVTMDWIGSQLVECSRGCNGTVKVQNFMLHFKSQCQDYYENSPAFSERQMAGKVVKQFMAGSSGGDQILQLPTRGQVSYIWKLTNAYRLFCGLVRTCRVKSSEACSKTVSQGTKTLTLFRDSISGGDSSVQGH